MSSPKHPSEKEATTEEVNSSTSSSDNIDQHHHGHRHHLGLGIHPHEPERHHDHFHPHLPTHRHTVIHAIHSASPPRHSSNIHTRKHLLSRPRARQYFTDAGDLHKQCDDGVPRQAGKFELFLDLLYIGLVANFAEDMIHHPTSTEHIWKYILIFIPAWRIWGDLTALLNSYYNDDILQRMLIAWIMVLMLLYGNNAIYIDVSLKALQVSLGAFLVARFSIICINLFYSITVAQHAFQLRFYNILCLITLPLWTPVFLPTDRISNSSKVIIAVLAFLLDQFLNNMTHTGWFRRFFKLKYSTAVDIDHHIDRMAAFFIIVLGEFLYGLIWASPAGLDGLHGKFGRAAMALIIAFCLCWLYISCDGSKENPETGVHALRWSVLNAHQWFFLHLPLSAALLIAGDICAVFVKYGDDYAGIDGHKMKRAEEGSGAEFPAKKDWQPLRWLFCGGLAIGVVCLYWISLLHHETDEDNDTRCLLVFPKWLRRITRPIIAMAIALLPLAPPEKMSITSLLGISTSLLLFSLLWEMVGGMDRNWSFVEVNKSNLCEEPGVLEGA